MTVIVGVLGRQISILGIPTVEVEVELDGGGLGAARGAFGRVTGSFERLNCVMDDQGLQRQRWPRSCGACQH
jgi:enolase